MGADIPIGDRIRFYREGRGIQQFQLAMQVGINIEYMGQIERGLKIPTVGLLFRIADALRVQVSTLFEEELPEPVHPRAEDLARAMVAFDHMEPEPTPPDVARIRDRVRAAWDTWQESPTHYADTCAVLPEVMREVGRGIRSGDLSTDDRRELHRVTADLYFLARPLAKYLHRHDMAVLASDRALRYAEAAEDPNRIATARWNLSQALLTTNHTEGSLEIANRGIELLAPMVDQDDRDAAAITGSLHLTAAVAEARLGDQWAARARVNDRATPIASKLGPTNVFWMQFTPSNVSAHRLSVDADMGKVHDALRLIDDVEVSALRSVERRATHLLTVARCYDDQADDLAVLHYLGKMEQEAPEDARYRGAARDLVRGLLKRARPTLRSDVRALAQRLAVYA